MPRVFGSFVAPVLLVVVTVSTTWAGPATDQLRTGIDDVLATLGDGNLKGAARRHDRRVAVQKIIEVTIDFREVARRALGRHWGERTEAEREEFVVVFSGLIERSYLGKLDLYEGEKVAYLAEQEEGDRAVVRTRVTSAGQGNESLVDFHMGRHGGDRWLVYDVVIDGASLAENYRTQFNAVLRRSSYPELVKKIKATAPELK